MRARPTLSIVVLTGLTSLVLSMPALAQTPGGSGYAWTDSESNSATVGAEESVSPDAEGSTTPARGGGGGGGGGGGDGDGATSSPCTWTPVDTDTVGDAAALVFSRMPNAERRWYLKECTNPDGTSSSQFVALDDVDEDVAPAQEEVEEEPPDPEVLRAQAVERLELPSPAVAMNPPGEQVVHVPSWLWLDGSVWQTRSESASAGGVTATVTATPTRTLWDMGSGDVVICDGPGEAYDPGSDPEGSSSCSYTYRNSSAGLPGNVYPVTVTVEWEVGWSVTGADGGGALPGLSTSTSTSVPVAEVQALNP